MKCRHVLLIDNNKKELLKYQQAMETLNLQNEFECLYANNARKGMRILSCVLPDYIFIDMQMPRENGLECLAMIRNNVDMKNIPVIVYSNGINGLMAEQAIEMGASSFVKKPPTVEGLAELLRTVMLKSKQTPAINTWVAYEPLERRFDN